MFSSKSLEMQPLKGSFGSILMKSQLRGKPAKPLAGINLSNRVAIVTGASTGLGFHCCRHLLSFQLTHLIIAVRSVRRGEDAASRLRAQFPGAHIEVWTLEILRVHLSILILNSGIGNLKYNVAECMGHEEVLQVNYLSTVLLSILVLPALKMKSPPSAPGRLTILGSGTALGAKFPSRHQIPLLKSFDDKTKWDSGEQYFRSKLLGQYFIVKLVNYINPEDVVVNIVDPGFCKGSSLFGDVSGIMALFFSLMKSGIGRTAELESSTYVDAAVVKGKESHGCFIMDWEIRPFAALLYAPDSKAVIEQLWFEMMEELEFAGPVEILEAMRHSS